MTRQEIIAALEPFAAIYERWSDGRIYDVGVEVRPYDLERAAEVLAELRKPTGFEEWWEGETNGKAVPPGTEALHAYTRGVASAVWDAATLSGREPYKPSEEFSKAVRCLALELPEVVYEDFVGRLEAELNGAQLSGIPADLRETLLGACKIAELYNPYHEAYADARKRLEAGPVVERMPEDLRQKCIDMARKLEDEARYSALGAALTASPKAKRYEDEADEYAKIAKSLEAL